MANDSQGLMVKRWTPDFKKEWDAFVNNGKNATFLFLRDYMDYHSDRFIDHSLMIYRNQKLIALLPANLRADGKLVSHDGLTYGGFIFERDVKLTEALEGFYTTLKYLDNLGIELLLYKRIPRFFNTLPSDDVDYAFFLLEARLYRRDCAQVISFEDRLPFQKGRKSEISKAKRFGITLRQDFDFKPFWNEVLIPRLRSKHDANPVHSLEEITLLAGRFPDKIKLFSAYLGDNILAGTVIYEKKHVAHAQYIAVSENGSSMGALDYLFNWLINEVYRDKKYFDFGICNENEGKSLNHGLLNWKQGFGARTNSHDFYEIITSNYYKLNNILSLPDNIKE